MNDVILLFCMGLTMYPGILILIGLLKFLFPYDAVDKQVGKDIIEDYTGISVMKQEAKNRRRAKQESGFKNRNEVWHAYRSGKISREELDYWKRRL